MSLKGGSLLAFGLVIMTTLPAVADSWSSTTVSDMRNGCYGVDDTSKRGPCLIDISATNTPRNSITNELYKGNCGLFSDKAMIESCKALQSKVHTADSCGAGGAATCTQATACVEARQGVMTYFSGRGAKDLSAAIKRWSKSREANRQQIDLGRKIRTAMENPTVLENHRIALKEATKIKLRQCNGR